MYYRTDQSSLVCDDNYLCFHVHQMNDLSQVIFSDMCSWNPLDSPSCNSF
uniref:Uncharacterized protein n=1 Tax=Arundo donax TaxID=35708 RepID=A0A0A8ZH11_ARUDO